MITPQDVLRFWLEECDPADWYRQNDALDAKIRETFMDRWQEAEDGGLGLWLTCPSEALAYIILTDQFPRNMFRGDGRSFATDHLARSAAKMAIDRDWDLRIDPPARQFFYLPLMHSENLTDQDRAVRLLHARMPEGDNGVHAQAHREVIREFGRFPYRNAALDRTSTKAEVDYLANGGYGLTLRKLQADEA
ncbi:DUF924 domain-containing protein [Loktanella sp. TSTF-M6]|uniref:DUF924 domain-containing protein n=1 Tax=Loktanella gaetbuli TaxID=2881335 RepID=A0ABS8BRC6_9RHOB|nr:DUF924 family protein [Loktanella gaetbuli]MCB5198290.1 DUF924 domain-containing protein [Loktanella gaetbuli]